MGQKCSKTFIEFIWTYKYLYYFFHNQQEFRLKIVYTLNSNGCLLDNSGKTSGGMVVEKEFLLPPYHYITFLKYVFYP